MMHMIVDFTRDVQFVFESWYAQSSESPWYFVLGMVLSFLYCFCHIYFAPKLQAFLKEIESPLSGIIMTAYHFVYQLSNIIIMMIMMTMNFWVGLVIAGGCGLGFALSGASSEWKKAVALAKEGSKEEHGCCHHDKEESNASQNEKSLLSK